MEFVTDESHDNPTLLVNLIESSANYKLFYYYLLCFLIKI